MLSFVMGFLSMFSSLSVSFLDSKLGLIDLSLGDLRVSLIGPEGIGSESFTGTVDPGLIGDVLHGSALVVVGDFKSGSVLLLVDSGDLGDESFLLLEFIESPSGADLEDFLLFIFAGSVSVDDLASLVGVHGSGAGSGELVGSEGEVGMSLGSKVFDLTSLLSGLVMEGVVVGGEHLPEDYIVGVGEVFVEGVSVSKTEGIGNLLSS